MVPECLSLGQAAVVREALEEAEPLQGLEITHLGSVAEDPVLDPVM